MHLLNHFAAFLVATSTPAPHPQAEGIALAGKLSRAKTSATAERACSIEWEPDSDGWHSCVVGLESWRCEVQRWCSGGISVVEIMPLPDAARAGSLDWDAL